MAKPGVVLRRPVGSDGPFGEHAEMPTDLGDGEAVESCPPVGRRKPKKAAARPVDKAAERKAALAYEREQKRRERDRQRRRQPGRRSVNAGNAPSIRRKPRWTGPSGNMQRRPPRSKPRWRL